MQKHKNRTLLTYLIQYKHALILPLYGIFYLFFFALAEQKVTTQFHVIEAKIDRMIPFVECFVIPYIIWFPYIAATVIAFVFINKNDYYKLCINLCVGMTLFLIISFIYPNGHLLRPTTFPRYNIFTDIISTLYKSDTSTNILPSIHCYNSIVVFFAIWKSEFFKKYPIIIIASFILSTLIVLSTVFIKQHSIWDMISAFALSFIMYLLVYVSPKHYTKTKKVVKAN